MADDDFARALGAMAGRCGESALFVTWSVATAAAYLVASGLPAPKRAERIVFTPGPYRASVGEVLASRTAGARVTPLAWAMVIGQVTFVFAIFVLANLRHLFGGRAVVRAPGATTYASYLHAGFAQLLVAAGLSVCLVLVGPRWLRPRDEAGRLAPVPGGRLLVGLEGALLALTGVTNASCAQRLAVYEEAYGATIERLGVAFIGLIILGVLILTLWKVVARGWRGLGGATLTLVASVAVVASAFNADAYVATTNLNRAARGKYLDMEYLASLSCDARSSTLSHPFVRSNRELALVLADGLGRDLHTNWRARRGLGRCRAP